MSRPVAIPGFIESTHDAVEALHAASPTSNRVSAEFIRTTKEQQAVAMSTDNLKIRHGSSPSSPTARNVWQGVFNPGRNANMPRGASRFDTAEPGSPTTWDYVVRAEKLRGSPPALNVSASSPTSSDLGTASPRSATVDMAKLDALMRQTHKGDGKLCYAEWTSLMQRAST